MKTKTEEKRKALSLRKQGLSYNEILQKVPVAKSSVSLWCRNTRLTVSQQARLVNKQREAGRIGSRIFIERRKKEIEEIKALSKQEIKKLNPHELKIVGAMIYWAEGSKSRGIGVEITNSDPELIKFMICWLDKVYKIPLHKLKACLNIHANQDDMKMKKYWSKMTRIPLNQFGKSYIKPEGTGHRKNILHNGVIKIRFGSEDLRHRIMAWIEALHSTLNKT